MAFPLTLNGTKRRLTTLLASALVFWSPVASHAQIYPVIEVLGANPVIGGAPVMCRGIIAFVALIPDDMAKSFPGMPGMPPALYFRPEMRILPPMVQLFMYAHECAHQFVGLNETAADCMAVKMGHDQGFLTPAGLNQVCASLISSPGDWTHAPGQQRCFQMQSCYQ